MCKDTTNIAHLQIFRQENVKTPAFLSTSDDNI
jgi:hypothetical protein